jgi:hypothetical protein
VLVSSGPNRVRVPGMPPDASLPTAIETDWFHTLR